MRSAKPLGFRAFDPASELAALAPGGCQAGYLTSYLLDLGATDVLEEPYYFDRDYLSEFAAFYGTSARGHANVCRRLHFFCGGVLRRETFAKAAEGPSGDENVELREINAAYLGFIVVRPTPATPFGRTVLRWYTDTNSKLRRVTSPSRPYHCHVAGVPLQVHGLAWQQQDRAVSACATVALWTMLHSSAFDDSHAVPTTADITTYANRRLSWGRRVFPASGLSVEQSCGAIGECGLSPALIVGNVPAGAGMRPGISPDRFASSCAALIRSGYPVMMGGDLTLNGASAGPHALTVVGYREAPPPAVITHKTQLHDGGTGIFYLHDDNIGPNARFKLQARLASGNKPYTVLTRALPTERVAGAHLPDQTGKIPWEFRPAYLLAAVHDGLRMSPDSLHTHAITIAQGLEKASKGLGLAVSSRFVRLRDYFGSELEEFFATNRSRLAIIRLDIAEKVPPMSLHLGMVRIGLNGQRLLDVLLDTTDSDIQHPAFCHVVYDDRLEPMCAALTSAGAYDFGALVPAY